MRRRALARPRYEKDVARQSDLERCGWTFSRVREGAFRLEPGAALEDLWQTLERLGIFPAAGDASPDAADPTASPDSDQEFPDMLIDPETGQLRVEDRGPRPACTLDRGRARRSAAAKSGTAPSHRR